MKLRKNEMKLRKNAIKVPKNCFVPPWRMQDLYGGNSFFLGCPLKKDAQTPIYMSVRPIIVMSEESFDVSSP